MTAHDTTLHYDCEFHRLTNFFYGKKLMSDIATINLAFHGGGQTHNQVCRVAYVSFCSYLREFIQVICVVLLESTLNYGITNILPEDTMLSVIIGKKQIYETFAITEQTTLNLMQTDSTATVTTNKKQTSNWKSRCLWLNLLQRFHPLLVQKSTLILLHIKL